MRGSDTGSGTLGALLAFVMSMAVIEGLGIWAQILALILVTLASFWSAGPYVSREGDAAWIVVDEAAGAFVATIGLGVSPAALVAFLVFRAADIFKGVFPGVAAADALKGTLGVTLDDLVAGFYGLLAGQAVRLLL